MDRQTPESKGVEDSPQPLLTAQTCTSLNQSFLRYFSRSVTSPGGLGPQLTVQTWQGGFFCRNRPDLRSWVLSTEDPAPA